MRPYGRLISHEGYPWIMSFKYLGKSNRDFAHIKQRDPSSSITEEGKHTLKGDYRKRIPGGERESAIERRVEARPWRRAGLGKAENNDDGVDDDGDGIGGREGGREGERDEGEKRRAAARNAARERAGRRERKRGGGGGERGATSSSSNGGGGGGGGGGFRPGQVTGRENRAVRSVDRTKLPPMPRGGGGGDCDGGSITPCRALTMANESERTLPLLILLPLLTLDAISRRAGERGRGAWSQRDLMSPMSACRTDA
ncbi:hypothetical protein ALC56_12975 [Trachymyrmex septentrionalis]|uniref:Uncharacterized protein n=1 Tax=Trachymyrmex septentrionalis TaxID=34720 RepID=A0A195EX20_9HYME|nr:hypothetical protein ALC56_12975 [Trachymyrmex septentrionalis]